MSGIDPSRIYPLLGLLLTSALGMGCVDDSTPAPSTTPEPTATGNLTPTPTDTPWVSPTESETDPPSTPTASPGTPTGENTETATPTPTADPMTQTPEASESPTDAQTPTGAQTDTPAQTETPTPSIGTPTAPPEETATETAFQTPTPTAAPGTPTDNPPTPTALPGTPTANPPTPEVDADEDGYSVADGDCDDGDETINPGATEVVCNLKDDDCDAQSLDAPDGDDDGYALCDDNTGAALDCDDLNPDINPGAEEVCNGLSDDCDDEIDEGVLTAWYVDEDGDGFGVSESEEIACEAPDNDHVEASGDCNDGDDTIYPGATEMPNGVDDDCDGAIDNNNPPVVTLLPLGTDGIVNITETLLVSAQISDDGHGPAHHSAQLMVDGEAIGSPQTPDEDGFITAEATLGCGEHDVVITAVDPFEALGSDEATVTGDAPITIDSYALEKSVEEQGRRVYATATFSDSCDSPATAQLQWVSNIDGPLFDPPIEDGPSTELSTVALSAGTHALTLRATQPGGLISEETRSIEITPYECDDLYAAYFPFDEGEGHISDDLSGNGNHLTLYNAVEWGDGPDESYGFCAELDGLDDHAKAPDSASLDLTDAVSVDVWLYLDTMPPDPLNWWTVVSKGNADQIGTDRNYSLYVRNDGVLHWSHSKEDGSGQVACQNSDPGLITAGEWIHVAVTASGRDGGAKAYYINGELMMEGLDCGFESLVTNDNDLWVGDSFEPYHEFDGRMDELKIRPCELTEGQVRALYDEAMTF